MVFSARTKRLGYGEDLRGIADSSGNLVLSYKGRDGVVRIKKITKDSSGYTASVIGEIGASIAQPLHCGKVIRVQNSTAIGISEFNY